MSDAVMSGVVIARHCSGEDTETTEVYETDGDGDVILLLSKALVFAQTLQGREFSIEHMKSDDDGYDPFEVILFTVDK